MSDTTKNISFTLGEAQVAVDLFNLAVKAQGLSVAGAAASLAGKFTEAFPAPTQEGPSDGEPPTDGKEIKEPPADESTT
jgi:hypothetical protein